MTQKECADTGKSIQKYENDNTSARGGPRCLSSEQDAVGIHQAGITKAGEHPWHPPR